MMVVKKYLLLTLLLLSLGLHTVAYADDDDDDHDDDGYRHYGCRIAAATLDFGHYNPLDLEPIHADTAVRVKCYRWCAAKLTFSIGAGDRYQQRKLVSGQYALFYNLYLDSHHTMIWGDGSAGTYVRSIRGYRNYVKVYGEIPAGQNQAGPGHYRDEIIMTVEY